MGKVEKIVVLSVLFVIVLILVVSLDTGSGGKDVQAADGKDKQSPASRVIDPENGEVGDREDPVVHTPGSAGPSTEEVASTRGNPEDPVSAGDTEGDPDNTGGLLLAIKRDKPVYEAPEAPLPEWDLITLGELADHLYDETNKVYTAKAGDTFAALAKRYYGTESYERLLRRANEGYDEPTLGQQILVPTQSDGMANEPMVEALPPVPEGASTYTALDGESLWIISKKLYGKGHLWPRIWDANKGHRLDNPDFVPEGVTLIIPAE
ncbi:MAG: LysM peptidoglycan-binding domain-containing protein [Planctomycetota bacterium]|nr:LysM peptidoglycan-binding domain-containing protein [Planctomycetota bacterium]